MEVDATHKATYMGKPLIVGEDESKILTCKSITAGKVKFI